MANSHHVFGVGAESPRPSWTMVNLSVTNAAMDPMLQNLAALGLMLGLVVLPTIVLVAVLTSKRLSREDDFWN
jgi:hypothetical protein